MLTTNYQALTSCINTELFSRFVSTCLLCLFTIPLLTMNILVTGGAGYIGSHTVRHLLEHNHTLVVLDNLSTGHLWALPESIAFVKGDIGDQRLVEETLSKYQIEAVVHFAAHIEVEESTQNPLKYFKNNTANTINLLSVCQKMGVQKFIFSSTAAVYGNAKVSPIKEDAPLTPMNPYGESKLLVEKCLNSIQQQSTLNNFRFVILRYFNVAGASSKYDIGPSHPNGTHLIKVACQAATQQRDRIHIFGTNYNTPDGTCVRDYIHVDDLANAHVLALDYLNIATNPSVTLNCGYGHGYSVRQVLDVFQDITKTKLNIIESERRPGDPEMLSADNHKIKQVLKWSPRYNDLSVICSSAYEWEKKLLKKK